MLKLILYLLRKCIQIESNRYYLCIMYCRHQIYQNHPNIGTYNTHRNSGYLMSAPFINLGQVTRKTDTTPTTPNQTMATFGVSLVPGVPGPHFVNRMQIGANHSNLTATPLSFTQKKHREIRGIAISDPKQLKIQLIGVHNSCP